jgi:hypothetical protein
MKQTTSWDVKLSSLIEFFRRFAENNYCPHFQGQKVSQASNRQVAITLLLNWFAYGINQFDEYETPYNFITYIDDNVDRKMSLNIT